MPNNAATLATAAKTGLAPAKRISSKALSAWTTNLQRSPRATMPYLDPMTFAQG
jgi:hypothetical protein